MTNLVEAKDNKNNNNNANLISTNYEKNKNVFFKIFYDYDKHIFYLMDLGIGYGTFFKIEEDIIIKDNNIINIGESYLIFSFKQNNMENEDEFNEDDLYLKIYSNEREYDPMIIPANTDRIYQIGRSDKCDIYIRDKMLSRIHFIIYYLENNWYIKDGNTTGQESTNGTWIFLQEDMEIKEGMKFKSNNCTFNCKFD